MQIALRLEAPFAFGQNDSGLLAEVLERVRGNETFGLNALDFLVAFSASERGADDLGNLLTLGGSEWEVAPAVEGQAERRQLTRRTLGPVKASIDEIRTDSQRAHEHLEMAWRRLVGRDPDPSSAYREAIRAVEAAAKPVVSPNNARATLGTIIADLRNKPSKWTVSLEAASVENVADLASMIWTSQLHRHGTDDETVPLSVSQEEADAAFYIAIGLVRLFAGKHIRPQ
jgi:hypothetical protein